VTRLRTSAAFPTLGVAADGRIQGPSGRWLKPFPNSRGYLAINVSTCADGIRRQVHVHKIVCTAYHGPCPDGMVLVRHLNGDHLDNRAANLAWGTREQNEADKVLHGTALLGERHHQARLTDGEVLTIRASVLTGAVLAATYGVSETMIGKIRRRKNWRHI
jgi:hypothetical protein